MVIQASFWEGRRVLVTGHTGFKGSWLAMWLQTLGARVVGYALPPATQPNLFTVAGVEEQMLSTLGDIRDSELLSSVFSSHQPEVVFHLAAQALVLPSYAQPAETYSTNVMGTVNLLDAVRQNKGVRAVVIVTSDKCYEHSEATHAHCERDPLGGGDPYSSSKACAELVTAAFRSSFFNPPDHASHGAAIATARAGNAIGGGDWSTDRLIPDAIRAFVQNRPLPVRHPRAIRPWQHVLEPLAGYLMLAEQLHEKGHAFAEAWNFGPSDKDTYSVEQVLETLTGIWGGEATWTSDRASHPPEAHCLRLDVSKAISSLGWHPRWSIVRALKMTADWYRAQVDGKDMAAFSKQQIGCYCDEARGVVPT